MLGLHKWLHHKGILDNQGARLALHLDEVQSLIANPTAFKDCKVVRVPMGEDSVVCFCSFLQGIGKLGENSGVISGGKCSGVHDGESVTDFCDIVNKFFLFFSNNFYRAIVFCGDFIR